MDFDDSGFDDSDFDDPGLDDPGFDDPGFEDPGLDDPDEPWVVVASYRDLPPAHIASGLLEARGLRPKLSDEHTVGVDWLISSAIGGVSLLVPESQAEAAIALLEKEGDAVPAEDLPEELQDDASARVEAEADYFEGHRRQNRFIVLLSILFVAPFLLLLVPVFELIGRAADRKKRSRERARDPRA